VLDVIHSFNTDDAEKYGVNAAILLSNIQFWVDKNKANGRHIHDGYVYTYNSVKAWGKLFPYMSSRAIRTALAKLVDAGVIQTGNFNQSTYDRTLWYGIKEDVLPFTQSDTFHLSKTTNGFVQNDKPIPDSNTDFKLKEIASSKFIPPTIDEITNYCQERKNSVNPQNFIDHYATNGWMRGKNNIKDWKACVRTWENKGSSEAPPKRAYGAGAIN